MGISIDIKPSGVQQAVEHVARIVKDTKPTMHQAAEDSLNVLFDAAPGYPSEPPGSTYARTGKLGVSVRGMAGDVPFGGSRVETMGGSVKAVWGTTVPYADFVIGYQAWMHKGRWWTMKGVFAAAKQAINAVWTAAIRKLIS